MRVMARNSAGALLLLAICAATSFQGLQARLFADDQVTAQKEHLKQSTNDNESSGGAAKDNTVGWSMSNAKGYNPAENVACAVGLTQCHYTPACNDLQTSAQYCGSCDLSCDLYTQECKSGACVCKEGFSVCAARGGRCLDAKSCPAGGETGSHAVDINTQDVGGTVGILG